MKKKLLLFTLSLALFTLSSNAQNKVYDFSDTAIWTSQTGVTTTTPNYLGTDLTLISSGSATGVIASSTVTYPDTFVSSRAMVFAGVTGPAPTNRAVSFPVTGPCTITIWVTTSSTSRTASISDGTNVLGSFIVTSSSPKFGVASGVYTASGPGTIYVYCSNTMSIAKIAVSTTLGTEDFKADSSATVYANGNQVFVSNVKSNTTIAVYSVAGALVKTVDTSSDTSFDLGSGVYVAKVKSAEGEKSVKLLVK